MAYGITDITVYNLSPEHLGSEVSEQDASGYRAWLAQQLTARFPGAAITTSSETSTHSVSVQIDGDEEYLPGGFSAHQDEVEQYLAECWDRCPWDWV